MLRVPSASNRSMSTAETCIGLARYAYGPVVTSCSGRSHGYGVPLPRATNSVTAATLPSPDVVLKVIGVGNWWLPKSVDRRLPQLRVEGRSEIYLPAPPADTQDPNTGRLEEVGAVI